jgi:hypothetical protein
LRSISRNISRAERNREDNMFKWLFGEWKIVDGCTVLTKDIWDRDVRTYVYYERNTKTGKERAAAIAENGAQASVDVDAAKKIIEKNKPKEG